MVRAIPGEGVLAGSGQASVAMEGQRQVWLPARARERGGPVADPVTDVEVHVVR
jgi:hypothetical protein